VKDTQKYSNAVDGWEKRGCVKLEDSHYRGLICYGGDEFCC